MSKKFDPTQTPYNQWPLLHKVYWPNTLFLLITPFLMFTLTPWHIYVNGLEWKIILFFGVYSILTSLSITAGYHRLLAHKSYEASPLVKFLYLFFGAGQFQGSAVKWCSDHRRHHHYVDSDSDPYSISKGFFYAHVGWVFLKDDPKFKFEMDKDLVRDPLCAWQDKYYVPIAAVSGFLIPFAVGAILGSPWGGLIFAGIARVVVTQHCTFFINSLCHTFGRRPFSDENSSTDSFFIALFTYGEGYHNFHHKFQADYRNGIRWFDWDPTKWLIRLLSFFGLTRQLKRIPYNEILKARLNIQEKHLLLRGAPAEKVETLRSRIQGAQQSLRKMKEDYKALKDGWNQREQVQRMRAELAVAHLEFKMAYRQWKAYYRMLRS